MSIGSTVPSAVTDPSGPVTPYSTFRLWPGVTTPSASTDRMRPAAEMVRIGASSLRSGSPYQPVVRRRASAPRPAGNCRGPGSGRVEAERQRHGAAVDSGGGLGAATGTRAGARRRLVGLGVDGVRAAGGDLLGVGGEVVGDAVGGEAFRGGRAECACAVRVGDRGERLKQGGGGVGLDEDLVGERTRVAGHRLDVGFGDGVPGVLRDGPLQQRQHLEQDDGPGRDGQRRRRQHPGTLAVGFPAVLVRFADVVPGGEEQREHRESQEQRGEALARDHRRLVPPRDAVAGHVPPAVGAGERDREDEQDPRGEQGAVPFGADARGTHPDRREHRDRAGETRVHTEVVGPLGGREHHQQQRREHDAEDAAGRSDRGPGHLPCAGSASRRPRRTAASRTRRIGGPASRPARSP